MQPCIYSPATRRNSPSDWVLFILGGCNRAEPSRGHRGVPSGPARRRRRGEGRRSRAGARGLLQAAGPSAGLSFLFPFPPLFPFFFPLFPSFFHFPIFFLSPPFFPFFPPFPFFSPPLFPFFPSSFPSPPKSVPDGEGKAKPKVAKRAQ